VPRRRIAGARRPGSGGIAAEGRRAPVGHDEIPRVVTCLSGDLSRELRRPAGLGLQRPDRLRVRHRSSDGNRDLLLFDGKSITLYNEKAGVYAQVPQPGSLDDAIVYFVRDLKMRLPLARLFTNRSSEELARRLQSVIYIERTELLPVPTDHIAGRVGNVDVQLWIAEGNRPLPMRVVLTYVDEPGQPQYRTDFQDWKLEAPKGSDTFRFSPPAGARKIVFATQVPSARTSTAQRGDTEAQP
jgi:hypothetical protein